MFFIKIYMIILLSDITLVYVWLGLIKYEIVNLCSVVLTLCNNIVIIRWITLISNWNYLKI